MKPNSTLLQLNAFTWISQLREKHGQTLTLGTIPQEEWDLIRHAGFDAVWLMGVWHRSPRARAIALEIAELKAEYSRALPGWTPDDVAGSPYAVWDYSLDPFLGKPEDLARVHRALKRSHLKLILDFVPNHLAIDHPWTVTHPERFVRPSPACRRAHADWFFQTPSQTVMGHGRDPHFLPWSDTAQVNAFNASAREAMRKQLERVAAVCDGVRCDMAMLLTNDIFEKTWSECGGDLKPRAPGEFWDDVLQPVKRNHPGFTAIAECYWNTDLKLLSLGFDFFYDKNFYDRLMEGDVQKIRGILHTAEDDQHPAVRFVENHDEARFMHAFGPDKGLAALAVTMTVPGLKLWHHDQERGWQERVPIQLKRFLARAGDPDVGRASGKILEFARQGALKEGRWHMLNAREVLAGSRSHERILSWIWTHGHDFGLVVVNYGSERASARLHLPDTFLSGNTVVFKDWAREAAYERPVADLIRQGLYVELDPWKYHLLTTQRSA